MKAGFSTIFALFTLVLSSQTIKLDSSNLPIIIINTKGQTIGNEPKITAQMYVVYNGPGKMNYTNTKTYHYKNAIGIEVRGNSSQSYPQKQYGIETRDSATGKDIDFPLIGMPEEEDWVLYAPYNDISMLRNVMTYYLWNQMGHWGPRTRYCEVILNNEYVGVYILMESIKKSKERVDVAGLSITDTAGIDLTGGYIMKIDKKNNVNDKSFISKVKSTNNQNVNWLYHYPESDDILKPQEDYIHRFIDSMELVIAGNDFKDSTKGYHKYISIPSFIDYFLITEFSRNADAYKSSSYFYKEKLDSNGTKGKFKAGPVWDYNLAFGNVSFCAGAATTGWMYDGCMPATLPTPILWRRLLQDPAYANEVKCRYTELRKTLWDTNYIFNYLHKYAFDTLDAAQKRHYTKWKILGTNPGGFNGYIATSYPDEMNKFKAWIRNRLAWMDANLIGTCAPKPVATLKAKMPLDPSCTDGRRPMMSLNQPFSGAPYLYTGTEKLKTIPNNIVRWVLLEIRSAADSTIVLDRRAALLRADSLVVDTNLLFGIPFHNLEVNKNYRVLIRYNAETFLLSSQSVVLPNTLLNLNILNNVTVAQPASNVYFDYTGSGNGMMEVCEGSSISHVDSSLISLGYRNLVISSSLHAGLSIIIINPSTVEIKAKQSGEYPIELYYSCDGKYLIKKKIMLRVHPKPQVEITGPTGICKDQSITLTSNTHQSYRWNEGALSQTITINKPGTYSVSVTNAQGCVNSTSHQVIQFPEVLGSIMVVPNPGANTCTFNFELQSGVEPLKYQWSNGDTTVETKSGMDSLTVQVTDANGCKKTFVGRCIIIGTDDVYSGKTTLFPNPTQDQIFVTSQHNIIEVNVMSIDGKLLLVSNTKNANMWNLQLKDLSGGIYFLVVKTVDGTEVYKVYKA